MSLPLIPVPGSRGLFVLAAPFAALVENGIEYTCQGVRKIRDYLAANEDVKSLAYSNYGVEDKIYEEDLASDAFVVSLQSTKGHWLYVPHRYILKYPTGDGIVYRSLMLGISIPSIPLSQDVSGLMSDLKNLTDSALGINCIVKSVDTSQPVLISYEDHIAKQVERAQSRSDVSLTNQLTRLNNLVSHLQQENDMLKQALLDKQ